MKFCLLVLIISFCFSQDAYYALIKTWAAGVSDCDNDVYQNYNFNSLDLCLETGYTSHLFKTKNSYVQEYAYNRAHCEGDVGVVGFQDKYCNGSSTNKFMYEIITEKCPKQDLVGPFKSVMISYSDDDCTQMIDATLSRTSSESGYYTCINKSSWLGLPASIC